MPVSMILKELKSGEKERSFELKLILQIAALLKNKKESGMVMLSEWELCTLKQTLRKTGIRCFVLNSNGTNHLTLLFRRDRLRDCLMCEEVLAYLRCFGYASSDFGGLLKWLANRCRQYAKKQDFPHEIGLFLGYPLCDVQGFIRHKGECSLYSGYWKIYGNLEQTLIRFRDFDHAKNEAVLEWFSGKSIPEIAA